MQQITLVNQNNDLTIHLSNPIAKQKFLDFIQSTDGVDYCVEFFEFENLSEINQYRFVTEIRIYLCNNNFIIKNHIDISDFTKLKTIYLNEIIYKHIFLPENLKNIYFCCDKNFNYQLNNLPSGLELLYLESCEIFNHQLNNLPSGLKTLYLNSNYSQPLNYLPDSLIKFVFLCNKKYTYSFDNLPNQIEELNININSLDQLTKLPSKINKLVIGSHKINLNSIINYIKKINNNKINNPKVIDNQIHFDFNLIIT